MTSSGKSYQPEYDLPIAGEDLRYSKGEGETPAGLYKREGSGRPWQRIGDLPSGRSHPDSIRVEAGLLELAFQSGWRATDVQREPARATTVVSLEDDHHHRLVLEVDRRGRLRGPQTYMPPDAAVAWVGTVAEVSEILEHRTIPKDAARNIAALRRRFS